MIVTEPCAGSVVIVPVTVVASNATAPHTAPPVGSPHVASATVVPSGSVSRNVAPSAALGPAFAITSFHWNRAPARPVAGPVLTSDRFADGVLIGVVEVPVLLPGTGSTSVTVVTEAALTSGVAPVYGVETSATIWTCADDPEAIVPSVQVTTPAALAQPEDALWNVTPAGSVSDSVAPALALGPLFWIVIVHVIVLPGVTFAGPALVSARSAVRRDVVAWVVALLARSALRARTP